MARRKDMAKDLQEAIQHLKWASYRLSSLYAASIRALEAYQKFVEEVRGAIWLSEECDRLSEELTKKWEKR